eukprot:TRINITY_DN13687_c0_g1_i1.p1 TRINITY_DN13687_c0_g1~~TRINITY_DN13687_c0_g1_i1.p1  ORF type:complete len:189 (+),score=40.18 TRINITY_DN13687_c0_g1_i1:1-567(+)
MCIRDSSMMLPGQLAALTALYLASKAELSSPFPQATQVKPLVRRSNKRTRTTAPRVTGGGHVRSNPQLSPSVLLLRQAAEGLEDEYPELANMLDLCTSVSLAQSCALRRLQLHWQTGSWNECVYRVCKLEKQLKFSRASRRLIPNEQYQWLQRLVECVSLHQPTDAQPSEVLQSPRCELVDFLEKPID